jgi:3-hydroxyisobutyrate dehydrogenase-like beta-hydroxyacid dehydrogenase
LKKSKKKYLFIGLGTMGYPMAGHLSQNNELELFVYNRTRSITTKWLQKHKGFEFKIDELVKIKFDGFILCLKDDASIINVLIDQNLIKFLKYNSFIIDHSTTSLDLIHTISSNFEVMNRKISYYDSPVSGGEIGAVNGNLSVMFGGPNKKIKIITSLMNAYSDTIVKIGPSGHGQLTKMINQLCIAGLLQGLAEAIALGKSTDLNMLKVYEAISGGAAQSWQMDNRFVSMINNKFDFGFAVDLMIKDLEIALKNAESKKLNLMISKNVLSKYKKLSKNNFGKLDTSSLIKLFDVS